MSCGRCTWRCDRSETGVAESGVRGTGDNQSQEDYHG